MLVTGYGFVDNSAVSCSFGGAEVPARYISESEIECESPPAAASGALNVEVSVNGVDFFGSGSVTFLYGAKAVVGGLSPTFGETQGGTSVTVTGNYFEFSEKLKCRFGAGNEVSAGFVSSTEVVCVAPVASSAGTVDVAVSNNGVDFDVR